MVSILSEQQQSPTNCAIDDVGRIEALHRYHILDTDYDPRFDDLAELGAFICDTPIAVINFVDKDRQWFKSEIGLGIRETPLDVSVCAHALLQKGVFVVPDMSQDSRFKNFSLVTDNPHLRFYAGALLETDDGFPLGTFCVLDFQPRQLSAEQEKALSILARQVMIQLELRRTNEQQRETLKALQRSNKLLEIEASTDELTKLANRRAITHALQYELALMQELGRKSSALLIDLDFFKTVNDQYGHLVGDEVLKEFAEYCNHEFRSSDIIGRWGGEEFIIILPGSNLLTAEKITARFQRKLNEHRFAKQREVKLTFSGSLIELSPDLTARATFKQLDDTLYQAKQQGRNRIISVKD